MSLTTGIARSGLAMAVLAFPSLSGLGRPFAGTPMPPVITAGPTLVPGPNPNAPLAASIVLKTNVPTKVSLFVNDGFRSFSIPDAEPSFKLEHEVLVLGVHANRSNQITVIAKDQAGGQALGGPVTFVTPPLPSTFPPIAFQQINPGSMEPGYTLMEVLSFGGTPRRFTIILDNQGQVVWFLEGSMGSTRMRNGHLVMRKSPLSAPSVEEIDMLGNTIQVWYPSALNGGAGAPPGATLVEVNNLHHEFVEMPVGEDSDFLALSAELRTYPDYPSSYSNPSQKWAFANVIGDVIVELDRDGTIVREKKLLDVLDPYRVGYDSLDVMWRAAYGQFATEWAHASSVMFDASDDTYIVSMRHQDCIVKVRRAGTGSPDDVVWILGNHARWRQPWRSKLLQPVGRRALTNYSGKVALLSPLEFEWPYHQHSAFLNSRGNLVCFDNGNYRATPPAPPLNDPYSRAPEYRIDPQRMTVEQVWAAGGSFDPDPDRLGHSSAMSSVQALVQTGNVLVCSGLAENPGTNARLVHLLEFRHVDPPVPVMEMTIEDPDPLEWWGCYRARRIPSLYP